MTSASTILRTATPTATSAGSNPGPRLRLKVVSLSTGYIDGAWWPRSRDLIAELPDLLGHLTAQLGRIERVNYNLTAWGPTVRQLIVNGTVVRLNGYRTQNSDTLNVVGTRHRITLVVVPPEAPIGDANYAMFAAAHGGSANSVAETLAPRRSSFEIIRTAISADRDQLRWELDGGSLRPDSKAAPA